MASLNGDTMHVTNNDSAISTSLIEQWMSSAESVDVAVVGGGVSGLSAVSRLVTMGVINVVLLEAQDKLGGRVSTFRDGEIVIEDGAQWIHGGIDNPLYKIADSLGHVATEAPEDMWDTRIVDGATGEQSYDFNRLFQVEEFLDETYVNGILEPYYNTGYGQYFLDKFPKLYGKNWGNQDSKTWMHYLEQRLNSDEGTEGWMDISARDADQWVDYGEDFQWTDGYDSIVKYLKKSIPNDKIHLSSPVKHVIWDLSSYGINDSRALVSTSNRKYFLAKQVLITTSVGFIKLNHETMFQPALTSNFTDALKGIELGTPNKVFIGWPSKWWGDKNLYLNVLWSNFTVPSTSMEWLFGVTLIFSVESTEAVLEMFISGKYSRLMEQLPEDTVKNHTMQMLHKLTGVDIPNPTFFRRTKWASNPYTCGSYSSYLTLEGEQMGIHSREIYQQPIVNTQGVEIIRWAGEHTSNDRYGTVDGALVTGRREAAAIQRSLKASN